MGFDGYACTKVVGEMVILLDDFYEWVASWAQKVFPWRLKVYADLGVAGDSGATHVAVFRGSR